MSSTQSPKQVDAFDDLVYRSKPGGRNRERTSRRNNDDDNNIEENRINRPSYLTRPKTTSFSSRNNDTPPKTIVKFFIHEEVSSVQEMKSNIDDISCHVNLEGTVYAQITSSEAGRNPPVALRLSDPDYPEDNYQFDTNFITYYGKYEFNTLSVPKAVLGQVRVATYQRAVTKKFMPLLLQSKVIRTGAHLEKCQVAIQIRSNLKNKGSLKDLIVCCAVPPSVVGKSLKVTIGDGTWDELKRVIRWNVKELDVGKSLLVGAEIDVSLGNILIDELPKFPVMIRCSSTSDTVSSLEVELRNVKGHPTQITTVKNHSFRLLHRLPY